jgi:hypothetical protein
MSWSQSDYLAALTRLEGKVKAVRAQLPPAKPTSEADLHEQIFAECRRRGWIPLHGAMSERTHRTIGEPDFIIIADRGQVLFVECKSSYGKLRPEQQALHIWMRKLGHTVHVVRSLAEFLSASA